MSRLEQDTRKDIDTGASVEIHEGQIAVQNIDIIVIAGPSGVGKTGIGERLATWYGVPSQERVTTEDSQSARFVRAGVMMREWAKEREQRESIGYIERTSDIDQALDTLQKFVMEQADAKDGAPLILEGRLAGYLLNKLKQDPDFNKTSIALLITAEDEIRKQRLVPRELSKLDEGRYSSDELVSRYGTELPTDDDIWEDEKRRRDLDLATWRKLHIDLEDPFDPELFDIVIDTGNYGKEESAEAVHEYLLKTNAVTPIV